MPEPPNPQALNRYSYCSNNPVGRVDPSGHDDWNYWDAWSGGGYPMPWEEAVVGSPGWDTADAEAYWFVLEARASGALGAEADAIQWNVPAGARLDENLAVAKEKLAEVRDGESILVTATDFATRVAPNGPWDYKRENPNHEVYQDFGNFNYGAAGAGYALSEGLLLSAAGAVQMTTVFTLNVKAFFQRTDPVAYPPSHPFGGPPYGDHPRDQTMIALGVQFYKEYSSQHPEVRPSSEPNLSRWLAYR